VDFKAAVLKRDTAKIIRPIGTSFLGKEDNVGLIDGTKVYGKRVESRREVMRVSLTRLLVLL
jgi:hypothetical protein